MAKPASGTSLDLTNGLTANLEACLAFLEGAGGTSADSTGNGYTATINSPAQWTTIGSDTAINFPSASNQPIALASTIAFDGTADWTVAFRARQAANNNNGMIAGGGTGLGVQEDYIWLYTGGNIQVEEADGSRDTFSLTQSNNTTAANYVLSYDQSEEELSLYVNGSLEDTAKASGGVQNFAFIGNAYQLTSLALIGDIEYFYAWDGRALTSGEASTLNSDPYAIFQDATAATITVTTPTTRGFQRDSSDEHSLTISGTYDEGDDDAPTAIQYRWNGGSWVTLDASPSGGTFSGSATLTKGQGTVDVRYANSTNVTDSTETLTVGFVAAIAGQSNAEGRGTNPSTHSGSYTLHTYRQDGSWRLNNSDPTDTETSSGSIWPLLSQHIEADQDCPVILITTATGGTALVDDVWLPPSGTQYTNMVQSVTNSGVNGVDVVLWYQGESDVIAGVTEAQYETALAAFADAAASDLPGSPKTCALQLGYTGAAVDGVRKAIAHNWDAGGNVFGGPAMYDQTALLHPANDSLMQTQADRYFAALKEELFGGASGVGRGPKITGATTSDNTVITVTFNRVLKTGLTFETDAWTAKDDATPVTISSVAYNGSDTSAVDVTLNSAASGSITISLGEGVTAVGHVLPVGPDFVLPDSAGTINLPAEPFVDYAVTPPVPPVRFNRVNKGVLVS